MRDILDSAAQGAQFVVLGDTAHNIVPLAPITDNVDVLTANGQTYLFVEQHYALQPIIEQLRDGTLPPEGFTQFSNHFNDNEFWGHTDLSDLIVEATQAGMHVVAFDTRTPGELGYDPAFDVSPDQLPGYPPELLPAIQAAYDSRGETSFDERSATFIREVAGDERASVFVGNAHIHGGHADGTPENDLDGFLGEDNTARVTMFYDMEQAVAYMNGEDSATRNLACAAEDRPDFVFVAAEGAQFATPSALERGFGIEGMRVADLPAPCFDPENQPVLPQDSDPAPLTTPFRP